MNESCCGVAGQELEGVDRAAGGFDDVAADDVFDSPVAAFYEDVRLNGLNQLVGSILVKGYNGVHTGERGEHIHALLCGVERARRAFEAAYRVAAVDADDEKVTELASAGQKVGVPSMQNIETAVGENDAPGAAQGRNYAGDVVTAQHFFLSGGERSAHSCVYLV